MSTARELFRRLEDGGLAYAVLRNYENLPDLRFDGKDRNTDIDLVVDSRDLPAFREILRAVAHEMRWDALTECDHFTRSRFRHHNIEIFRMYRIAPLEFLQIDVFHGYVNLGLPLMDEAELLSGRRHAAVRGLTHIDPLTENMYRLVQLHASGDRSKFERNRSRVMSVLDRTPAEFRIVVRKHLGGFGIAAVDALADGDRKSFDRNMQRAKQWAALRFAVRHPVRAAAMTQARRDDNRARFVERPCGQVLAVHAETPAGRERLREVLETLRQIKAIPDWVERPAAASIETPLLEQGGLSIEWVDGQHAEVVVERGESAESLLRKLFGRAMQQHRSLYSVAGIEVRA